MRSFTLAFDGLNAFTRDPADLSKNDFPLEASKINPDVSSGPPGSFTRLFGSGEGVLTPPATRTFLARRVAALRK